MLNEGENRENDQVMSDYDLCSHLAGKFNQYYNASTLSDQKGNKLRDSAIELVASIFCLSGTVLGSSLLTSILVPMAAILLFGAVRDAREVARPELTHKWEAYRRIATDLAITSILEDGVLLRSLPWMQSYQDLEGLSSLVRAGQGDAFNPADIANVSRSFINQCKAKAVLELPRQDLEAARQRVNNRAPVVAEEPEVQRMTNHVAADPDNVRGL